MTGHLLSREVYAFHTNMEDVLHHLDQAGLACWIVTTERAHNAPMPYDTMCHPRNHPNKKTEFLQKCGHEIKFQRHDMAAASSGGRKDHSS